MKTSIPINTILENTNNLTSVWRNIGIANDAYHLSDGFEYSGSESSSWPNRLWFTESVSDKSWDTSQSVINDVKQELLLSYFDTSHISAMNRIKKAGWELVFEQVGMSLPLKSKFPTKTPMWLKRIHTYKEAVLWCDLFENAFNYRIQPEIVFKTTQVVEYWLACIDGVAVGTVLTHSTGKTIGIHAVGVPPRNRRKGYAEDIMNLALNNALEQEHSLAVLQASALGFGIYKRLGFAEEFTMGTYKK